MKNRYLKLGYFFNRLLMGGVILIFLVITALMVGHFVGALNIMDWLTLVPGDRISIKLPSTAEEGAEQLSGIVVVSILKNLSVMIVLLYVFYHIEKVLKSVEDLSTFQVENISNFKKMGAAFFVIAIINFFQLGGTAEDLYLGIHISFPYILAAIGAFLLSEVFREGHELYEQNRLMI